MEVVRQFLDRRPTLKENNQSNKQIFDYLEEELQEARESSPEMLGTELADLIWYTYTLALTNGIDIEHELIMKAVRNDLKYPEDAFQEGDYEDNRMRCKREWAELGGDSNFYE